MIGIGGGGDVVGSLAVARLCESLATPFVLGGVAWERFAVDPYPGPRSIEQIVGGRRLDGSAVVADAATATPEGVRFCEAGMSGFLGEPTLLVDVTGGPGSIAGGILAAAGELRCDLAVYVDIGGDALAEGSEPGLASPLCDAVMLAGARRAAAAGLPALGAVLGSGCDAELTVEEVLRRLSVLGEASAWVGAWAMPPAIADELEAAAGVIPTEASLQAARCARGEIGPSTIRGGRRTVPLGPVGGIGFFFDPLADGRCLPLAHAVADASDLESAREALEALGIRTELDYERDRAAERC